MLELSPHVCLFCGCWKVEFYQSLSVQIKQFCICSWSCSVLPIEGFHSIANVSKLLTVQNFSAAGFGGGGGRKTVLLFVPRMLSTEIKPHCWHEHDLGHSDIPKLSSDWSTGDTAYSLRVASWASVGACANNCVFLQVERQCGEERICCFRCARVCVASSSLWPRPPTGHMSLVCIILQYYKTGWSWSGGRSCDHILKGPWVFNSVGAL